MSIQYYEVRAAALYKTDCLKSVIKTNDDVIVETSAAPFNQSAGDVTDLEAKLSVHGRILHAEEDQRFEVWSQGFTEGEVQQGGTFEQS